MRGQMDSKMWSIHTVDEDSALIRKEIPTHATTRMTPRDIMLSEIGQSQNDRFCVIPLIGGI